MIELILLVVGWVAIIWMIIGIVKIFINRKQGGKMP